MDSVRDFKDKWYVLHPITQTALDSLFESETVVVYTDGEPLVDAEGRPVVGRISRFPIHWCSGHYDHGTGYYHTPAGSMSAEDEEAYVVLCKFVDSFFPVRWVTREGDDILDEDGYPTFEARPINTKVLVECQSYGKAVALLGFSLPHLLFYSIFVVFARLQLTKVFLLFAGDMAERRERLLKLTKTRR